MVSAAGQENARDGREDDAAARPERGPGRGGRRRWWPRPETTLLVVALLWTLGAKIAVIAGQGPDHLFQEVAGACLPDFVFFAAAAVLFALTYLCPWPGVIARLTMLASAVVLLWAVMNAAWLIATGVQLQPGVLRVLAEAPGEFWPVVQTHLEARPQFAIPILITLAAAGVWFIWRLIRPLRKGANARPMRRVVIAGGLLAVSMIAWWGQARGGTVAYSGQVIGFSSHWYAFVQIAGRASGRHDVASPTRVLPRVGERSVAMPEIPTQDRPNVVVIFLESISWDATSLSGRTSTPYLEQLASEGVEFVTTRVPVAQTSKAFWTALTGCYPDLTPDYAESVLVDKPYESLPSLLRRVGYRSAFFEMSRGSFECAPGVFANLGFDWAWFRENLGDESAYLGYMNGDDFRMIDPMFKWVDEGSGPFLLSLITSVSHDPYVLPDWYDAPPTDDRFEQYLQTVRYSDDFLERVCAELEDRGLLENTILCVFGDHGDGFRPESPRGRWTPFEEVIRIPWVIRWPGHVEAGRKIEWPCSQLDITPTILSLLDADIADAGFDGVDAMQPIPADRRQFFSTWYRDSPIGFVEGDRKLVYWPYTGSLFEYDLADDPGEREPRTVEGPGKETVIAALREWEAQSRLVIPARRFRESVQFRHWRTFSSGRSAWAYYVP